MAVAEERNFRRAADRLNLAQPAISRQIRLVERELGFELFDRATRPVTLTAAGAVFLVEARRTLDQAGRAVARGREAHRGEVNRLSLGTVSWACNGAVPAVMRDFRARFPDTRLEVSVRPGIDQVEALLASRLDIGFAGGGCERSPIASEQLFEEPLIGAVPDGHPLTQRGAASLDELLSEPYVCISRLATPGMFEQQMELLRLRGRDGGAIQEAPDIQALLGLVAAGLGVTLLPASSCALRREGVAFVPLEGAVPVVSLFILWRRDEDRDLVQSFVQTARDVARAARPASPRMALA